MEGLAAEGRPELVPQVHDLVIDARCGCQQGDCATIFVSGGTSPLSEEMKRDRGPYWCDSILLESSPGHVVVDTDRYDRISHVEVLGRDDVRQKLANIRWKRA
jgi:hypothetical protein